MSTAARSHSRPSSAWLLLPIVGLGMVVASASVFYATRPNAVAVSQVHRDVRSILLHRSTKPDVENGGAIGPWWVAASEVDEVTGEFREFRLRSGPVRLAAASASLRVNPDANTISFELNDVVLTIVPGPGESGPSVPSLVQLERYVLGPAPYQRRIVPDGGPAMTPRPTRIAGAADAE